MESLKTAMTAANLKAHEDRVDKAKRKMEKRNRRDDNEFCIECGEYVFTDCPHDDSVIGCGDCTSWYCVDCAKKLGVVSDEDGVVDEKTCPVCVIQSQKE